MRKPIAALKRSQEARKRRERCMRMQERRRGIAGRRKRGSWWGKMERRAVAERAERARALRSQVGIGTRGQVKRERSMAR